MAKETLDAGKPTIDIASLANRIEEGERAALARGITLIESRRADHRAFANDLLELLMPNTGKSVRVGISGVPGVGKSTMIDLFGATLTDKGHKVAVLAVDPSSSRTGGSILGDKTRMERLSVDRSAFIRPSPSAGTLGGVAAKTREAMLLCEAAGFDVILVETVGTGQSETAVSDMVDFFLVLMLPGAGDELQGIKKGILELADAIAVNKADGENIDRARAAAAEYRAALHIMTPQDSVWSPPVMTVSGQTGDGLDDIWATINQHRDALQAVGRLDEKRRQQNVRWMWSIFDDQIKALLRDQPNIAARVPELEHDVAEGGVAAARAAATLLALLRDNPDT